MFLTRGMLSNNAAATAGKGENLLHLGRARKKGPFPNFPQRGTPLISGLLFFALVFFGIFFFALVFFASLCFGGLLGATASSRKDRGLLPPPLGRKVKPQNEIRKSSFSTAKGTGL